MVQAVATAVASAARAASGCAGTCTMPTTGSSPGQARAVLELMAGRENKPVTAWAPEAVSGHRGRPTLLSNAETFAHVAAVSRLGPKAYAAHGNPSTPGTVLLTLDGDGAAPEVLEVPGGSRLVEALATRWLPGMPVLLGGYHGTWLTGTDVEAARLDRDALAASGFALGAGVVLPLRAGALPRGPDVRDRRLPRRGVRRAVRAVPVRPADDGGRAASGVARGGGNQERLLELAGVVTGRGACAHPDGTARLVRSLVDRFPAEVAHHLEGRLPLGRSAGHAATGGGRHARRCCPGARR